MTKSILAALALTALLPATAAAQTYPVTFGILGGATFSKISTEDDIDLKNVWGAQAGVFADKGFTPSLGGRIEVLVSQRGAKNEFTNNTVRFAYLDVPVLIRIGNTSSDSTHFHAFTGLTPSFLLKTDQSSSIFLSSDINTDQTKSFDLGWVFGAGVEQNAWSFDARYTFGLMNLNDAPAGAEYKNRSLSLNIGYRFGR
jgi:hypothetical protein